ncbi:hypothetical protein ROZALSC1DRAFT_30102, partial [Rozella allomycis CSF55]
SSIKEENAVKAKSVLEDKKLHGRNIQVDFALKKKREEDMKPGKRTLKKMNPSEREKVKEEKKEKSEEEILAEKKEKKEKVKQEMIKKAQEAKQAEEASPASTLVLVKNVAKDVDQKQFYKRVKKLGDVSIVSFGDGQGEAREGFKKLDQHVFKGETMSCEYVYENRRLIIRNLDFAVDEEYLKEEFGKIGLVTDVQIPVKEDGQKRGFAFVEMGTEKLAKKIIKEFNGKEIKKRPVAIDFAFNKEEFEKKKVEIEEKEALIAKKREEEERLVFNEEDDEEFDMEMNPIEGNEEVEEVEEVEESEKESDSDDDSDNENDDEEESEGEINDDKAEQQNETERKDIQKKKEKSWDTEDGCTVFIRNILLSASYESIKEALKPFGEIVYVKMVKDKETGEFKGTAFARFKTKEQANDAIEKSKLGLINSNSALSDRTLVKSSLLVQDDQGVYIEGKPVSIFPAIKDVDNLIKKRDEEGSSDVDKRNYFLLKEGVIFPDSPAAKDLTPSELKRRMESFDERKRQLKNPNFIVSKTRLSVRNLPLDVDETQLKLLARNSVMERKKLTEEEKKLEGWDKKLKIVQVKIVKSKDRVDSNGKFRSKGYGFIQFSQFCHAMMALRHMNNNPNLLKKRLIVEFAIENLNIVKKRNEKLKAKELKDKNDEKKDNESKDEGAKKEKKVKKPKENKDSEMSTEKVKSKTDPSKPKKKKKQQEKVDQPQPVVTNQLKRKVDESLIDKKKKKKKNIEKVDNFDAILSSYKDKLSNELNTSAL